MTMMLLPIDHVKDIMALYFYQEYSTQTWQNGTPRCTDYTQHITLILPPIDHVTNI